MLEFKPNSELFKKIDDFDEYFTNTSQYLKKPLLPIFEVAKKEKDLLFSSFRIGSFYPEILKAFFAPKSHFVYYYYRAYICHSIAFDNHWFLLAFSTDTGLESFIFTQKKTIQNKKTFLAEEKIVRLFIYTLYKTTLKYCLDNSSLNFSQNTFNAHIPSILFKEYQKNKNIDTLIPKQIIPNKKSRLNL